MSSSRLRLPVLLCPLVAVCLLVLSTGDAALAAPGGDGGGGPQPGSGVWPLSPRPQVVGAFDPPSTPYGSGHRGVDLLGRVGAPVRSALPGTVTYARRLAGRGVVVVDHGGVRTTYEPVAASVRAGDHVAAGQTLGLLQLVASHCFPRACLHWGLKRGEVYLDPLVLVGGGPVRLLPLGGGTGARATSSLATRLISTGLEAGPSRSLPPWVAPTR